LQKFIHAYSLNVICSRVININCEQRRQVKRRIQLTSVYNDKSQDYSRIIYSYFISFPSTGGI